MDDSHLIRDKVAETTFKGAYKTYKTKTFKMPNGTTADFDVTSAKSGKFICCMALTDDMNIVISKEFRPGPEKVTYDLPMGETDEGESPDAAAPRELMEETGYEAAQMIPLNPAGSVVGAYDDKLGYFYLALGCKWVRPQDLGENEIIDCITMPLKEFINEKLRKGLSCHADGAWMGIDYLLQNKMITLDDIAA